MTLAFLTTPLLGLVDTAVVGRLGDPALIGGLAIAAILFDLVFTSFNFLRSATTGLVAQAFGRGDGIEEQATFWRSLVIGVVSGLAIIVIAPLLLKVGLAFIAPGETVAAAASIYFSIRIFSAPAALSNYALLGFLLGRGMGGAGLALQIVINGVNIILSVWLGLWLGFGIAGVAWATVIAEIVGCAAGFAIVLPKFARNQRPGYARLFDRAAISRLMALNADIMIRSFALIVAFAWFTRTGAALGVTMLAANAILMNLFMVASFYLDGFATAAEQLSGRAIGARYRPAFIRAVRLTTLWGFMLAGLTTAAFLAGGDLVIGLLTTSETVRSTAVTYLPWAAATALTGVLAFEMDGVFIGATWSRDMRNMMLVSLALFVGVSVVMTDRFGNHGLWAAFNLFLLVRGFSLALILPKRVSTVFG